MLMAKTISRQFEWLSVRFINAEREPEYSCECMIRLAAMCARQVLILQRTELLLRSSCDCNFASHWGV